MNHLSPHRNVLFCAVLAVSTLGVGGCGEPRGQVSGTVQYKGKVLTSGNLIFVDEKTRPTPPVFIQMDGTYFAPSVRTGPTTVLIDAYRPLAPEGVSKDSQVYKDYLFKLETYVQLPARYMDLKNSGVTFDVKSGKNTFNIELKEE